MTQSHFVTHEIFSIWLDLIQYFVWNIFSMVGLNSVKNNLKRLLFVTIAFLTLLLYKWFLTKIFSGDIDLNEIISDWSSRKRSTWSTRPSPRRWSTWRSRGRTHRYTFIIKYFMLVYPIMVYDGITVWSMKICIGQSSDCGHSGQSVGQGREVLYLTELLQ